MELTNIQVVWLRKRKVIFQVKNGKALNCFLVWRVDCCIEHQFHPLIFRLMDLLDSSSARHHLVHNVIRVEVPGIVILGSLHLSGPLKVLNVSIPNYPQFSHCREERNLQSGVKTSLHGLLVVSLSVLWTDLEISKHE